MRQPWSQSVALGLLACAVLLQPARASAYCLRSVPGYDGHSVWPQEVPYRVSSNLTDSATLAAIEAAFQTWTAVACSTLKFTSGGSFDLGAVDFKNPGDGVYVFWYTETEKGAYPTDPKYASYTFFGIDGAGAITQASIAINAFNTSWATDGSSSALDVQGEMTALVGKTLGIDVSNVADSVMTGGTLSPGDPSVAKRTLKQDDIDAVTHLYLEAGCPQPPAPGADCAGTAPKPDGGPVADSGPVADGGTTPATDGGTTPATDGGTTPATDGGTTPIADGGITPGTCTSSTQCADGEVCTAEGTCVKKGGDDGGCCAVAPRHPRPLTLLLTLGFGLWLWLRRRGRQ